MRLTDQGTVATEKTVCDSQFLREEGMAGHVRKRQGRGGGNEGTSCRCSFHRKASKASSKLKMGYFGTSLVAQGLRIRLPCRRRRFRRWSRKIPHAVGQLRLWAPSYWASALEPGAAPLSHEPWSPSSAARGAPSVRSLTLHLERSLCSLQLEKALAGQRRPSVV